MKAGLEEGRDQGPMGSRMDGEGEANERASLLNDCCKRARTGFSCLPPGVGVVLVHVVIQVPARYVLK
jgi:hypothetical protein